MPHRLTRQTRHLLEALLAAPTKEWYGLELMDLTKLSSGTMYPLLHRLQQDGWLAAAQEEIDPVQAGRPRRRLYRLTGSGEVAARRLLATRDHSRLGSRPTAALRPGAASA